MYILLTIACIIWGLNVLVVKEMLNYVPMFFLASIRIWITCLFLLIICKVKNKKITKKYNKKLTTSLYIVVLNFICTFVGMNSTGGSVVAVINGLTPFITLFYLKQSNKIIQNHKYTFALLCALLSVLISIKGDIIGSFYNVSFLILGLSFYCKGNVILQQIINDENYLVYTLQYQFIGAVILSTISFLVESKEIINVNQIPITSLLLFFLFSGFGFAFIQLVYSKSIYQLGSVKTSYFFSLNPIVTFIASFTLFGESIKMNLIISMLFLIASVILLNLAKE